MKQKLISEKSIPVNCSFGTSIPLSRFWKKLINLGYAIDLINHDIESQLQKVQFDSEFEYGRICGIIDTISVFQNSDTLLYDCTDSLYLLDILVRQNLIPFLELGNKQFMIQENTLSYISTERFINSEEYFNNLIAALPSFLHACINRYGEAAVSAWKFEISYPYTFFSEREEFTFRKYLIFFKKIAALIHELLPSVQIGGPGFNDWDDVDSSPRIRLMLRNFRQYHVIPDFITAYNYPLKHDESRTPFITDDPDTFKNRLLVFSDLVHEKWPDKEIWITEFNSNLSSRTYINDTNYQAVFLAKAITDTLPYHLSAMGYYLLSDSLLRYDDNLDFLFGGWGLLSDTGIPKPSYHIYSMLSTLGDYILDHGDNYIVTSNFPGNYHLLFFQYEHLQADFLRENISKEDLLSPDQVFALHSPRHYTIQINNAPSGIYFIKKYTISFSDSNLFHEWEKVQYLNWNRQYEYDDFERLSSVRPEFQILTIHPGEPISFDVTTPGLTVQLFLIEWHSKGDKQ